MSLENANTWYHKEEDELIMNKHYILAVHVTSRYVYTLRLIGPISYLGACYIRTTLIKCIREKMTKYFRR